MFNPRPVVRYLPIHRLARCIVVDDFLLEPEAMVAHAVSSYAQFVPPRNGFYPGSELQLAPDVALQFEQFFNQYIRKALGGRRTLAAAARLSLASCSPDRLSPLQRLCHRDAVGLGASEGAGAMVAYLFKDERLGGTSFYMPKRSMEETAAFLRIAGEMNDHSFNKLLGEGPSYQTRSNAWFDQVLHVPAAWNRAIFYSGAIFHSGHISDPQLLDPDPARGRLTMNGFVRMTLQAQAGS